MPALQQHEHRAALVRVFRHHLEEERLATFFGGDLPHLWSTNNEIFSARSLHHIRVFDASSDRAYRSFKQRQVISAIAPFAAGSFHLNLRKERMYVHSSN